MDYTKARKRMVEEQLISRGISDKKVLDAFFKVPRHKFLPESLHSQSYNDYPLPIGEKQTISQPYIVALMTEALNLKGHEKILELGTGSGYQTAILAELAEKVYSIEKINTLARKARKTLDGLGYLNIVIKCGDGSLGWKEDEPFDGIIVTAGSPDIPAPLKSQLSKDGGRLVIPIGNEYSQKLLCVTREEDGFHTEDMGGCRFVKLIGKYGWGGGSENGK